MIDTGSTAVTNAGLMEASGGGELTIQSSTVNGGVSGVILAATGSQVSLQSTHIVGGVLQTSGTGALQTVDTGSVLDGTTSTVMSQGQVNIDDATALTIKGAIDNTGAIALDDTNGDADLIIGAGGATLTGKGHVTLTTTGGDDGRIYGGTLTNVDNTISGPGQIGAGLGLTLVNQSAGVIDANNTSIALTIDTGSTAVANAGLIEATGAGGLTIQSAVANTGTLEASGGALTDNAAVSGGGLALIDDATMDFTASFGENVRFSGVSGTLELARSQSYGGSVTGFANNGAAGEDALDLADIGFVSSGEATFSGNSSGGTLTVKDATHTARIALVGAYTASTFVAASDGRGGTTVTLNPSGGGTGFHWLNPVSADFNTAADWSGGVVPGPADDAILDAPGATDYTVTASTNETVNSIQTAATATLSIAAGTFTASKGTGSGDNAGAIVVGDNTTLAVGGTLDNVGTISLQAINNTTFLVVGAGGATLTGGGHVTLGDDGNNRIQGATAAATLTNVNDTIAGGGQLGVGALTLINLAAGVIDASATNTALVLDVGATAVANTGLIEATGAAGLVISSSAIDGAGGGSILAATGSHIRLQTADIVGGTLKTAGAGVIETGDGGTVFDGTVAAVVNQGLVALPDNTALTVKGAIDNIGTISLQAVNNSTDLVVGAGGATLTGGGHIILGDDGNNRVQGATAAAALTNVNDTIAGGGQLGVGGLTLINDATGVIDASATNTALILNVGATAVANAGLVEATGAAGLVIQSSAIDDSGGGIILAAAGSHVSLQTADIVGGVLESTGAGVVETVGGGSQLDGQANHPITVLGSLDISDNTALTVQGAIDLTRTVGATVTTGAIDLNAINNTTSLVVGAASATIAGGAVTMGDDGANHIAGTLSGAAPNQTVSTLTNQTTISGAGAIGSNLSLTNDAIIDATGAGALIIATGNVNVAGSNVVTNDDLLEATNPGALGGTGGLRLSGVTIANVAGHGVIEANGATTHVDLQTATIEGGVLQTLNGGVIRTIDGGSVLDGSAAMVENAGTLAIIDNTALAIKGAIDNVGTISLGAINNATDLILSPAGATLTGGGHLTLDDDGANRIYGATAAAALANINDTISGAGQFGIGGGGFAFALTNGVAGVIDATGGNALVLDPGSPVTNAGLLEGSGAGGLTISNTTVDNAATGIILAATGSHVSLQTADIVGGTLETTGTGVNETVDSGTVFDGTKSAVANQGLVAILDNTRLALDGTIDNAGTINLLAINNATDLEIDAAGATLTGDGHVTLNDDGNNRIYGATGADLLTNVNDTISGAGQFGVNQLTLVNAAAGVIDATGANNALTLLFGANTVVNDGLIEATGAAGLTILDTTIKDAGGGVILAGSGSHVRLQSADLIGGTIEFSGSGLFQTTDGGSVFDGSASTFDNLAIVDIPDNTRLALDGTIDNVGAIDLGAVNNATDLEMGANVTLTGGGRITLGDDGNNRLYGATGSVVLTNTDNLISGAGQLGVNQLTLDNQTAGVIDADGTNNALTLLFGGNVVTNAGLIEATGAAGLNIQSTTINDSTGGIILAASGSHVNLRSADLIAGVIRNSGSGFFQTV
ncbi:MAG TPA: hypothetical protein VFC47_09995, partial [Caulobacteraceae bacterium]|nr:hypothetical protein [Caulobacteraceae bacterium]